MSERASESMSQRELTVLGACPLDCPDACGWRVTVRDGVAVGLRGDPSHPFTRGALCTKVNRYLEHAAAPDRVLYPMRRLGPKGSGRFTRISWDDALSEISGRLTGIIDRHGGEAIWPYWGTGNMGHLQGLGGLPGRRFFNVLGASNHVSTICSIAGSVGLSYTTGTSAGMDPEDFAHSRLIILWGTNTLTTGHHLWRFVQQARTEGAYVVAIDPLRTRTAKQADEHLAPIPGTDAALALGLLNVIVFRLGAEDRNFLARHTIGWPEFRTRIEQYPPEKVAEITGLTVEQIIDLGTRIARTRPTAIRATMGLQRHAGGGMALRTLACIPGVTGDWMRAGGGLSYSTSAHYPLNKPALYRDDLRPGPVRTLTQTRLVHGLSLDDPPVEALFVIAANPVASTPDQNAVRRALSRSDLFTVVLEQFPTDTVDYADIVLPATMQTEHADLLTGYGHLYLAWNEPAVPPAGECLSGTETFRRLAGAMGLTEPALYDSDDDLLDTLLSSDHPSLAGITPDRLRAAGHVRLSVPSPFLPFATGFPTPSGKLEFLSTRAAADGHDALPGYTPPREICDDSLAARFPLTLIATASHNAINTIFANNPELSRRNGPPTITLHPTDAAARSLIPGTRVVVTNPRGSFPALLDVADWVRPGIAATTKGHWPKLLTTPTVNATVAERDSDFGGGAVFHDNRVEITPAD